MHELSIAQAIVDVALRHARGRAIERVEVRIGALRQVVPGALTFAFAMVSEGTAIDGAQLAIEEVPAAGRCRACGGWSVFDAFPLCCATCAALDIDLCTGEELCVEALELVSDGRVGDGHHV